MQIKHRIKWIQFFFSHWSLPIFYFFFFFFEIWIIIICLIYSTNSTESWIQVRRTTGQSLMTSSWRLGLTWRDAEGKEAGASHLCGSWILLPKILVACGGASTVGSSRFLWRWIDRLLVFRLVVVDTWIDGWRMQIWREVYGGAWVRTPKSLAAHGGAWDSWWWSKILRFSDLEVRDWSVQSVCWKLEILWWQGFENKCDWWDLCGADAKKDRGDSFELYGSDTIWKT